MEVITETMTIERHFSVEQVARALGKDTRTILRWIEAGKIYAAKLPGRFNKPSYAIPQRELARLGINVLEDEKSGDEGQAE